MEHELQLALDLTPVANQLAGVRKELADIRADIRSLREQHEWLDVARAAETLGVHPATVRRAVKRGELRAKRVGRCLRVYIGEPEVVELARSARSSS